MCKLQLNLACAVSLGILPHTILSSLMIGAKWAERSKGKRFLAFARSRSQRQLAEMMVFTREYLARPRNVRCAWDGLNAYPISYTHSTHQSDQSIRVNRLALSDKDRNQTYEVNSNVVRIDKMVTNVPMYSFLLTGTYSR